MEENRNGKTGINGMCYHSDIGDTTLRIQLRGANIFLKVF